MSRADLLRQMDDVVARANTPAPTNSKKEASSSPEPTAKYTDFLSNLDKNTPIPEYRKIANLFPVGYVSQLISSSGTGKTWLLLKLASDLSTGNGILMGKQQGDQETCFCSGGDPVKVLIFAGEAGAEALIRRLRLTGWDYDKKHIAVFDNRKSNAATRNLALHQDESIGSNLGARVVASMIGLQARDDGEILVTPLKSWDKHFRPFSFRIGENPQTGRVDLLVNLDPEIETPNRSESVELDIVSNFGADEWFSVGDILAISTASRWLWSGYAPKVGKFGITPAHRMPKWLSKSPLRAG